MEDAMKSKHYYDPGDLENDVKVSFMICNNKLGQYAFWVWILSLCIPKIVTDSLIINPVLGDGQEESIVK